MIEKQFVSVIVNYFNPDANPRIEAMVRYCLECYDSYTKNDREIILVDGSGAASPGVQRFCESRGWLYRVCTAKGAFARIYNLGMTEARGDYRVWSASDIFVCQGWDERLIGELERTGAWMAAPYLTNSDYVAQLRLWPLQMKTFYASYMTFNLNMITKHCYENVGLMDERFTGNYNDLDYLVRIRRAGGEAIIVDAGQVLHVARGTASVASTFRLDQDLERFLNKYPELKTKRADWPYDLAATVFHRSRVYPLLLKLLGRPGRPYNWLSKLEPMIHAC